MNRFGKLLRLSTIAQRNFHVLTRQGGVSTHTPLGLGTPIVKVVLQTPKRSFEAQAFSCLYAYMSI